MGPCTTVCHGTWDVFLVPGLGNGVCTDSVVVGMSPSYFNHPGCLNIAVHGNFSLFLTLTGWILVLCNFEQYLFSMAIHMVQSLVVWCNKKVCGRQVYVLPHGQYCAYYLMTTMSYFDDVCYVHSYKQLFLPVATLLMGAPAWSSDFASTLHIIAICTSARLGVTGSLSGSTS